MYLNSVELKDYRCFRKECVDLVHPDRNDGPVRLPNISVLLGNNGSGKSSLLQGMAIGILNVALRESGWVPSAQRRRIRDEGTRAVADIEVELELHPSDQLRYPARLAIATTISGWGDRERLEPPAVSGSRDDYEQQLAREESPSFFLAAYGVGRYSEPGSSFDEVRRHRRYAERFQRIGSLLQDDFALVPLASWLPRSRRVEEVRGILAALLGDDLRLTDQLEEGDLLAEYRGTPLSVCELSDGYRSFLAWASDLTYRLERCCPPDLALCDLPGLVLVDEIDLHLHPEWQRRVVSIVSRVFPRLQFVFTTHSPLIVGSLEAVNLRVLRSDQSGVSRVEVPDENPYGLSADQVLLGPHFGLAGLRDVEFAARLEEVKKQAETGDLEASIRWTRMMALGAAGEQQP